MEVPAHQVSEIQNNFKSLSTQNQKADGLCRYMEPMILTFWCWAMALQSAGFQVTFSWSDFNSGNCSVIMHCWFIYDQWPFNSSSYEIICFSCRVGWMLSFSVGYSCLWYNSELILVISIVLSNVNRSISTGNIIVKKKKPTRPSLFSPLQLSPLSPTHHVTNHLILPQEHTTSKREKTGRIKQNGSWLAVLQQLIQGE